MLFSWVSTYAASVKYFRIWPSITKRFSTFGLSHHKMIVKLSIVTAIPAGNKLPPRTQNIFEQKKAFFEHIQCFQMLISAKPG